MFDQSTSRIVTEEGSSRYEEPKRSGDSNAGTMDLTKDEGKAADGPAVAHTTTTNDETRLAESNPSITILRSSDEPRAEGCFIAGTIVLTRHGDKAIESLQDHDMVLTQADPRLHSIRSDEPVHHDIPEGATTLYGFNDKACFFTANHVFFTTTGLRAINPEAAMVDNAWLQVGRLEAGHVLLHIANGLSYAHVTIRSISRARVACSRVYGVHLREGLRSYHVNGYLVHSNHPEITMKSITRALQTFPAEQREGLMENMKALRPLLTTLGAGAMTEMLDRDLAATPRR
jgi:hypothetical protein